MFLLSLLVIVLILSPKGSVLYPSSFQTIAVNYVPTFLKNSVLYPPRRNDAFQTEKTNRIQFHPYHDTAQYYANLPFSLSNKDSS